MNNDKVKAGDTMITLFTAAAAALRKVRPTINSLHDMGKTSMQALKNFEAILEITRQVKDELSFSGTTAESTRFTSLSDLVESEAKTALTKRLEFLDTLIPNHNSADPDGDTISFIGKMHTKWKNPTPEEVQHATSPAATAYAHYFLSLLTLANHCDNAAEWLEKGAKKRNGQGNPDLIGGLKPDKTKHDARESGGRGRPPSPNGRQIFTPTAERRLAAITIIELLRKSPATSIEQAVGYCKIHAGKPNAKMPIPPQTADVGDGGADYTIFEAEGQLKRWATVNGTTVTTLRALPPLAWEDRKKSLK